MKWIGLVLLVLMVITTASCQRNKADHSLIDKEWRLAGWSNSAMIPTDFEITATFSKDTIWGKQQ